MNSEEFHENKVLRRIFVSINKIKVQAKTDAATEKCLTIPNADLFLDQVYCHDGRLNRSKRMQEKVEEQENAKKMQKMRRNQSIP